MKIKKIIIAFIVIAISLIFAACTRNPKEITIDKAVLIAQPYFQELYGKTVVVEQTKYERIDLKDYRNIITVSDKETEYKLFLSKNNTPLFDNITAVDTIKKIDIPSFEKVLTPLGLKLHEHYDINWYSSYEDKRCVVSLSVLSIDLPNKDLKDGIYSLLGLLRNEGIDSFNININSPDFLLPKIEYGHHGHGVRVIDVIFSTDLDKDNFEKKYNEFVNEGFWDEQKFTDKISELTQLGYKNAYFYISRWYDGNTLEIVLYCTSDASLSDEQAAALIKDMDDSYIRKDERDMMFVLEHEIE